MRFRELLCEYQHHSDGAGLLDLIASHPIPQITNSDGHPRSPTLAVASYFKRVKERAERTTSQ